MTEPPATSVRVARALLDEHAAPGDSSPTVDLERACAALQSRLAPWIGPDGCSRLLRRALAIASPDRPLLAGLRIGAAPALVEGLEALRVGPPDAVREAAEALLAEVFEQLARFVGEPVAIRLVLPGTRDLWGAAATPDGDDA